jgi:hypothetical protein
MLAEIGLNAKSSSHLSRSRAVVLPMPAVSFDISANMNF